MGKKVVVTGGCGFIGSHVVDELLRRGYEVRILSRPHCDLDNIKHLGDRVEHLEVDVRERAKLESLLDDDFGGVLHFAALINVDESAFRPAEFLDVNVTGTVNLLEAARLRRVPKFLYMSSCEVYGNVPKGRADENHPLNPRSPYAASKFAAERYVLAYSYTFPETSIRIVRGFNQFGPRQSAGKWGAVIPKFITAALRGEPVTVFGDGSQTRDYVFVKDTARGIVDAFEKELPSGDIVNLATGKETSIRQIAEGVCALAGLDAEKAIKTVEGRPGEVSRSCGDGEKAARVLAWKPTVPFDAGLKQTFEWFASRTR